MPNIMADGHTLLRYRNFPRIRSTEWSQMNHRVCKQYCLKYYFDLQSEKRCADMRPDW